MRELARLSNSSPVHSFSGGIGCIGIDKVSVIGNVLFSINNLAQAQACPKVQADSWLMLTLSDKTVLLLRRPRLEILPSLLSGTRLNWRDQEDEKGAHCVQLGLFAVR